MWQLLAAMKRGLGIGRYKKSARVADESSLGPLAHDQLQEGSRSTLSVLLAIVRAPMVVATCFAPNGMEEVWASGERPRTSEMDHLMVRDSMRYAIYV